MQRISEEEGLQSDATEEVLIIEESEEEMSQNDYRPQSPPNQKTMKNVAVSSARVSKKSDYGDEYESDEEEEEKKVSNVQKVNLNSEGYSTTSEEVIIIEEDEEEEDSQDILSQNVQVNQPALKPPQAQPVDARLSQKQL